MSGIRCERCVNRLAAALTGHEGLEGANANLMGQVMLAWDDEKTTRDDLLVRLGCLAQPDSDILRVFLTHRAIGFEQLGVGRRVARLRAFLLRRLLFGVVVAVVLAHELAHEQAVPGARGINRCLRTLGVP